MDEMNVTEKYIQRLQEYLKPLGWSDDEILRLIDFLTKP